jgi:hypothetical protein
VRHLAQQYSVEALETLAAIMHDEKAPPAARVQASNSILDRGYGRPPQAVINANVVASKSARDYTDDELAAIIAGAPVEDPTAH